MVISFGKWKALRVACVAMTITFVAAAEEPAVPLQLQADLTVKVLAYVEQPALRSANFIHIGIVVKPNRAESSRFGGDLKAALDKVDKVAGLAHDQSIITWSSSGKLLEELKRGNLLVLYLAPGLDDQIREIAHALEGIQVITVAASDAYVANGCTLGFELISGHPKMVFNARQAKKQNVVFRSAVMKLMRIVE